MVFAVRRLIDRIREEDEEERRRVAVRQQAALVRKWDRLSSSPPSLNPLGTIYEQAREQDSSLRPQRFVRQQAEQERMAASLFNLQPPAIEPEPTGLEGLAQGFAPATPFNIGPPDLAAGGAAAQQFFGQVPPEDFPAIRDLAATLQSEGLMPQQFIDLPLEEQWDLAMPEIPRPSLGARLQQAAGLGLGAAREEVEMFRPATEPTGGFLGRMLAENIAGVPLGEPLRQAGVPVPESPLAGPFETAGKVAFPEVAVPSSAVPIPFIDPVVARGVGLLGRGVKAAARPFVRRAAPEVAEEVAEQAVRQAPVERVALPEVPVEVGAAEVPTKRLLTVGERVIDPSTKQRGTVRGTGMNEVNGEPLASVELDSGSLWRFNGLEGAHVRTLGVDESDFARLTLEERRGYRNAMVTNDVPAMERIEAKIRAGKALTEGGPAPPQAAEAIPPQAVPAEAAAPSAAVPEAREVPKLPVPDEETARAAAELERLGVPPIRGTSATVDKLTNLIRTAKRLKPAERVARRQELGRRAAAAGSAMERAEGRGRLRAGLGELRGELPSPEFAAPEGQLNPGEINDLFNGVADFYRGKEGQVFTQVNTMEALEKILMGNLPQTRELDLLEQVFGPELAEAILSKRSLGAKGWDELMGLINAPRTLMTTFDVSAILRQAVTTVGSREFYGNIPLYLRSFASQRFTDSVEAAMKSHPVYQRALDDKLALTFGGRRALPLAEREEAFMLPGERTFIGKLIRKIPGVRQSERGHLTFLSKLRLDMYANNIDKVAKGEGDALASMINAFTGRGEIGPLQQYTPLLSGIMFSARRQASLVQIPLSLFSRSAHVRKLAARNLLAFIGSGTALLSLLKLSGAADVELDPRSTNWGKIRVGPTRLDIWGGFQPMGRLIAQLATGERKTAGGAIVDIDVLSAVGQFLRNKLSPPAGEVVDVAKGETAIGEPIAFTPEVVGREAYENLTSLFLQDLSDAVREGGWSHGLLALPAAIGVGVQSYTTPTEQVAERFDKKYPDLAPYNPEAHRPIVGADPELSALLSKSGETQEREAFLADKEQELRLPEKAASVLRGNIAAVAGFDEAYDEFRSTAADAAARDFFGTEPREARTPEGQRYNEYREISPWDKQFENPETLEIDWSLYMEAKDAARERLPSELQQAIENRTSVQDEGAIRLARALRDWRDELDPYYQREEGRQREMFRRTNPQIDAILWITGSTTGVLTPRAQTLAADMLREGLDIRIQTADVSRRARTGGGRGRPSRR